LENADYVVHFGSDFLVNGHASVHDAWAYGEFRQGKSQARRSLGRGILVSFAPRANTTVACSDAWVPCKPGGEGWVALALGNLLAESGKKGWPSWSSKISLETASHMSGVSSDILKRVAARLQNARKPLAIAGIENGLYTNGVWSIAMIQMLNHLLTGKFQTFDTSFLIPLPKQKLSRKIFMSTQEALSGLRSGKFETVWVFDTNPRFLLPQKLNFEALFSKAKNKVIFTPYLNETALLADWVIATQSWMEGWGDRLVEAPYAKTYNLQQTVAEVPDWSGSMCDVDWLLSATQANNDLKKEFPWNSLHDLLKSRFPDEQIWENLLVRGGIWDEASLDWEPYRSKESHPFEPPPVVKSKGKIPEGVNPWNHLSKIEFSDAEEAQFSGEKSGQIFLPFYSSNAGDGSFANRPWMQELPDPMSSTVWTTWIEIPTSLAKKLNVSRGDVLKISTSNGSIQGPAFPNPGLHPDAVAVPVGQGHFAYGSYADNIGVNPLSILEPNWQKETGELAWVSTKVSVEPTGEKVRMITFDKRIDRLPPEVLTL
jgi:anaerobic selenocysteine-containing dehydrogenase